MSVLELPELLLAVLSHLDRPSLVACSVVCRAWHKPATRLVWAEVQDLGDFVDRSLSDATLRHFISEPFWSLACQPPPELIIHPPNHGQEVHSGPSSLDRALNQFKDLSVDWLGEIEPFKMRARHVTHLRLFGKYQTKTFFGLFVLHILQEHHAILLQDIFPCLTTLTFEGDDHAPAIARSITKIPSLRHITLETSNFGPCMYSWILASQFAPSLVSLTITPIGDPRENPDATIRYFPRVKILSLSSLLHLFISSCPLKHISLPGALVGKQLFSAIALLDSLETLMITGPLRPLQGSLELRGRTLESLHTLRLVNAKNVESYFKHITLAGVQHLQLDYTQPRTQPNYSTPYRATIFRACPNTCFIVYTVSCSTLNRRRNGDPEEFNDIFPESMFEPLLALGSLQRLVVRIPCTASVCLSDEFLSRAAQSWPHLYELNMDQSHSTKTQVTLQGLMPLARYCPKLSYLQLGVRQNYVHTVLDAELYMQENRNMPRCALTYLNVGCPTVYSPAAVSAFLSALFPNLRHVECSDPSHSDSYTPGDYFAWSQVVQTVNERDSDLNNLARMLRTQDLIERDGLDEVPFVRSSSDTSDEDYWAYSGSESENYSSDEDE